MTDATNISPMPQAGTTTYSADTIAKHFQDQAARLTKERDDFIQAAQAEVQQRMAAYNAQIELANQSAAFFAPQAPPEAMPTEAAADQAVTKDLEAADGDAATAAPVLETAATPDADVLNSTEAAP